MRVPYFTHGLVPHNTVHHLKDSRSKVELQPQALCWLSDLHITLRWLPELNIALRWLHIALVWLPTTRFYITRAPNLVTRLDVELHPLHRLPELAHNPTYSPALAPYAGSLHPVLPQGFP